MMTELAKLLALPTLVIIGWLASSHNPNAARLAARLLGVIFTVLLLCFGLSGWLHSMDLAFQVHRWGAHAFLILVWLSVPYTIGVVLQQHIRRRPLAASIQCFLTLLFLGLILFATFTGYLAPPLDEPFAEQTYHRFVVLHMVIVPACIAMLLVEWIWFFGPDARHAATKQESSVEL